MFFIYKDQPVIKKEDIKFDFQDFDTAELKKFNEI